MNKDAVLNFLTSLDERTIHNIYNANRDAMQYKWNESTLKAIIKGIWLRKESAKKFNEYLKNIGDE